MIRHLPAVLMIIGQLVIWAFYALFAVTGIVIAIGFMLELLHKLLDRITGGER